MTIPATPMTPIQSTVKPTTPAAPAPAAAPPPDATAAEIKTWQERASKAEQELGKKTRETIAERRKWEGEKKSFGEKLGLADKWLKVEKLSKVDPLAAAKLIFGDKALETLQTQAVNGGAPSAEAVALQLDNLREETEKKFAERETARQKAQEESAKLAEQNDRTVLGAETAEFYKAVASEYPGLSGLGDEKTVAAILANNFTGQSLARYRRALTEGDADTRVAMLRNEAAKLEGTLEKLAEGLVSHEKYAAKFREKLTPAKKVETVAPVVKSAAVPSAAVPSQQQARRTVTTDLTGSTPSQSSGPRSESDRMKAALARYAENASKT